MSAWRTWIAERRDWAGGRALVPVDTCYRILDLCSWSFAVLGGLALASLLSISHGTVTAFPIFWFGAGAVAIEMIAAIFRGLPFLVRYGMFAGALLVFLLCATLELGIPPNWSFLVILLLSSTGLLFGTSIGLIASGVLLALHIAVAWGWVTGRLPPYSVSTGTSAAYGNFHLASVWTRVLVLTAGLMAALQLLMGYVLGDMNRALEKARTALRLLTAEKELRAQTEQRFAAIFNQSPDICGIVRVEDSRILDVNRSFEALTGWTRAEAVGRTPLELGIWPDASVRESIVNQALEKGEVTGREIAWKTRAGDWRAGLISMRPMDIEGERVLNIGVRDVTEARREQDRLRALEVQLNNTQQMESLGVLAGGIAHDFNNILTGVLGFTELAQLSLGDTRAVGEHIQEIHKAGLRAKDLVAQILRF
ncbi:MAG TPA: PAS domain S-box protein, partial [Opitutaceae bacterium]|nr:PAS domain S-box protein [Opitutaceae bacterium]